MQVQKVGLWAFGQVGLRFRVPGILFRMKESNGVVCIGRVRRLRKRQRKGSRWEYSLGPTDFLYHRE